MNWKTLILKAFLENQFSEWNIDFAMNVNKAEWDFENKEISIQLYVV